MKLTVTESVIKDAIIHLKNNTAALYYYGLILESMYIDGLLSDNTWYVTYLDKYHHIGNEIDYEDLAVYFSTI